MPLPESITRAAAAVAHAFGGAPAEPPKPKLSLPGGRTVAKWLEESEAAKGAGYDESVRTALAMYREEMEALTRAALVKRFPEGHEGIVPLSTAVVKRIAEAKASVYGGSPRFDLVDADGKAIDDDSPIAKAWAEAKEQARLQATLAENDRLVVVLHRMFIRVSRANGVPVLDLFTPDRVYPIFRPGARSLDEAEGVLLEVESLREKSGKPVRRFEFWSAGDEGQNFLIDEEGKTETPEGNPEGKNTILDDDKTPALMVVSFSDLPPGAPYWLKPSETRTSAQLQANAELSNLKHVERLQGYGQWIATKTDERAHDWTNTANVHPEDRVRLRTAETGKSFNVRIRFGPGTIVTPPFGWTLTQVGQQAPLSELRTSFREYLRDICVMEGIPPGVLLTDARQASGVALIQEREPLEKERRDRVAAMRGPTDRVLDLVRFAANAERESDDARLLGVRGRFIPDEIRTPVDPETQKRLDAEDLRAGMTSRVRLYAERKGVSLEEARKAIAEIDADEAPLRAARSLGSQVVGSLLTQTREARAQRETTDA